jgi:hypothetical protein
LIGERVYSENPTRPGTDQTTRQRKQKHAACVDVEFPHPITGKRIAVGAAASDFVRMMKKLALIPRPHRIVRVRAGHISSWRTPRVQAAGHDADHDRRRARRRGVDARVPATAFIRPIRSRASPPRGYRSAYRTTPTISSARVPATAPSGIVVNEIRKDSPPRSGHV